MDIFNKKKVCKLERKIEELESELEIYRKKEPEKNSGKHETGEWCNGCKNLIIYREGYFMGGYTAKYCILDNKCKDREG